MSVCGSCGAQITWTSNVVSGKRMPVDAKPVVDGNVILLSGNDGPESRVLTKAQLAARPSSAGLFKSHHATCPDGPAWRRT
jgi:hypothetical protein